MNTKQVGETLVELCRTGKHLEALDTIYDKNIVSVEAHDGPDTRAETRGLAAVREKNESWIDHHEVHSAEASGPYIHGDRFAVDFKYDLTARTGPEAGKRTTMREVAVYTVKDGKIVREEFFFKPLSDDVGVL